MPARETAALLTVICMLSQSLSAEQRPADPCGAIPAQDLGPGSAMTCRPESRAHRLEGIVLMPAPDAVDILAGRGPEHARVLQQIAIYEAIGNRDGAEILNARLRAIGVSKEALDEAVNWTKLHAASPGSARTEPYVEPGWQASQ
jgi:hypothetical protein